MPASTYNLLKDFGEGADPTHLFNDPHWIVAIVRIGMPLSFSRAEMKSVTKDLTDGPILRAEKPLIITDDILSLTRHAQKSSHTKSLSATLKQTDVNYLREILPDDWAFAWFVNNRPKYLSLLERLNRSEPCNEFDDGLKFVGRVAGVRKAGQIDPNSGTINTHLTLNCVGFSELDTSFFYDNSLASKDVLEQDIGSWLTRIGIDVEQIFGEIQEKNGDINKDNINNIIPTLLDLIVGKGPPNKHDSILVNGGEGAVHADAGIIPEAPYAYTIPTAVGKMLGRIPGDASKPPQVMGYSDILELVQGIQQYSSKATDYRMFAPDLEDTSTPTRRITTQRMYGTFLPFFPQMTNVPLWTLFQQYLNPTINEIYTALRVNPEGKVVPTVVLRQIPFTTNAFHRSGINVSRFLDLPRWKVPAVMVRGYDIGRSGATKINFVHVYGSTSYTTKDVGFSVSQQIVQNPPIRDDLDIQRAGLRPYMTTVECWVDDTVGKAPATWMQLVADWTMGSHLTFNGTLELEGIQAPICEGDNLQWDGVVYHIEGVTDTLSIDPSSGNKIWRTSIHLVNGMRADDEENKDFPIYPGIRVGDNTAYDAGLSLEGNRTTGGVGEIDEVKADRLGQPTQLAPTQTQASQAEAASLALTENKTNL